jgi:hypothetical protein
MKIRMVAEKNKGREDLMKKKWSMRKANERIFSE